MLENVQYQCQWNFQCKFAEKKLEGQNKIPKELEIISKVKSIEIAIKINNVTHTGNSKRILQENSEKNLNNIAVGIPRELIEKTFQ